MTPPAICFVCANQYPLLANVTDRPVIGGTEVQMLLRGQSLRERGFKVSFIGEDFGQGAATIVNGFQFFSFRLQRNKFAQALALLRALQGAEADVYYVADMPKYGVLIYLFCRVTGRKIVQALVSDVEVETTKGDARGTGWAFQVHAAWRRRADLVIAQTQFQAQRLREHWGIAATVLPSVVLMPIEGSQPKRSEDRFRVLWVGRLNPVKRVEWVVDIAKRMPDTEFVVIGGAAVNAPAYVETVGPLLTACPNVQWLGYVPHGQVAAWFQTAQVLLHTSLPGSEGFPNVFLQAWAAGLPVVSTGSNPNNLLTEGGLGFCTSTVDEAVAVLQQLAADPALRQALGARGHQYVWDNHRPEAVIPLLASLFQRLLPSG